MFTVCDTSIDIINFLSLPFCMLVTCSHVHIVYTCTCGRIGFSFQQPPLILGGEKPITRNGRGSSRETSSSEQVSHVNNPIIVHNLSTPTYITSCFPIRGVVSSLNVCNKLVYMCVLLHTCTCICKRATMYHEANTGE